MPAVSSGCYRRPYGDESLHLFDAANVRQFFIRARKILGCNVASSFFAKKYVPENAKTGTCFLEMDPEMRKRAHVILLS